MKNKILAVIAAVLVVVATMLNLYHRAAYVVFKNLTAKKLYLDESTEWSGGESYVHMPYAEDSESQYLDLYVPYAEGEKPPLYVAVHGGGFISGDSQTRQAQLMYRYFRDHGYACATINYRLAQEAAYPAGLEDVKAAVRFLRSHAEEYGYSADHIAIFGESAGGYLASMAAVTNDREFMGVRYIGQDGDETEGKNVSAAVSVLVDYYGAVELSGLTMREDDWKELEIPQIVIDIANSWASGEMLQGHEDVESFWVRKDMSSMPEEEKKDLYAVTYVEENLSADSPLSVVIIHGDCDITVPVLQSERFYEAVSSRLGKDKTEFWIMPGEGHATDLLYADDVLERVDAFIKAH